MEETWWRRPDQLDEDQQRIISLAVDGNYLVLGPPGSGKTNLLLLRATYLWRQDIRDICVLTFTRMLKEFLAHGADNYPFPMETVSTIRQWAPSILQSEGIEFARNGGFKPMWDSLIAGLDSLGEVPPAHLVHDCLLLDEAQDYSEHEIRVLSRFGRQLFAVGDNNQRIYQADGSLAHLGTICQVPDPLRFHYRNGMKISLAADAIMGMPGSMANFCNYDEASNRSSVESFGNLSLADQVARAVPIIETQLRAYPDSYIGVMSFRKDDVRAIGDLLRASALGDQVQVQLFEDGYESIDPNKRIILTTAHSAKGLEFRAVHILAAETFSSPHAGHRLAFTAVTRAKTSLTIYHSSALPGFLERGIAAARDLPPAPPTLEDLF